MKTGIEIIAEEREGHFTREGFTNERDDQYTKGELAKAAACYAAAPYCIYRHVPNDIGHMFTELWPWSQDWYKLSQDDRIRDLAKAGALIAAEIDRLQRLNQKDRNDQGRI